MRFSLKWMLAAMAFVGYASAALYNASEMWAIATLWLTVLLLLAAVMGAVYLPQRAFCLGMALFGCVVLFLNYIPDSRELAFKRTTNVLLEKVRGPMRRMARPIKNVPFNIDDC